MASTSVRKRNPNGASRSKTRRSAEILAMTGARASDPLPLASEELYAAARETADAVNRLIDEAELVLELPGDDPDAYRVAVQAAMVRILETCAFEDVAGQRINKAAGILRDMEGMTDARAPDTASQPAVVLAGPGLEAPHMSQDEVDEMFDG